MRGLPLGMRSYFFIMSYPRAGFGRQPTIRSSMDTLELQRRQQLAWDAIKQSFGTAAASDSIDLFIEHHLEALPADYWLQQLGTEAPEPSAVLGLLLFSRAWGENDMEYFDFTLPGEVTQYVVCVCFDQAGKIDSISMES